VLLLICGKGFDLACAGGRVKKKVKKWENPAHHVRELRVSGERDKAEVIRIVSNVSLKFFHGSRCKAADNPLVTFSRISDDRSKAVRIVCMLWIIVRMYVKDESRGIEVGIVISEGDRVDMKESRNVQFCRSESIGVPFNSVEHCMPFSGYLELDNFYVVKAKSA
jgi:hypothetical protein